MSRISRTCPNCQSEVSIETDQGFGFCQNCGTRVELLPEEKTNAASAAQETPEFTETQTPETPVTPVTPAASAAPAGKNGKALALAIVGLALPVVFGWWFPLLGFGFGIAGLIISILNFSKCSRQLSSGERTDTMTKVSKWLSLAGIIVSALALLACTLFTVFCLGTSCACNNALRDYINNGGIGGFEYRSGNSDFSDIIDQFSGSIGMFL